MQTEEYEIVRKLTRNNRILLMINSLLCISCLTLIFLISCQSSQEEPYLLYTVQSGDTLTSISELSGTSVAKIRSANDLENDLIRTGDVLKLEGVKKISHGQLLQELNIVTRSEWGARKATSLDKASRFTRITVHHTTDNKKFKKTDLEFLKLIQKHHQTTNKWADIGYHFLIGQHGIIYEGRSLKSMGAHVKGKNEGNIGIALLGDFNVNELKPEQLESLKKLIDALRERYDIPKRLVFGHGELGDTKCPGKHTLTFLKEYRR